MFSYINGTIKKIDNMSFIIECNNIGYLCHATKTTINKIILNEKYLIYTKLFFRDTNLELYGFYDINELECFNMFIKISGLGTKVALNILSYDKYNNIYSAIINENIEYFTLIPGIGIKTAKRIIIELKDKLKTKKIDSNEKNNINEIIDVLLGFGYQRLDIVNGIKKIKNINNLSEESILDQMLKMLK